MQCKQGEDERKQVKFGDVIGNEGKCLSAAKRTRGKRNITVFIPACTSFRIFFM